MTQQVSIGHGLVPSPRMCACAWAAFQSCKQQHLVAYIIRMVARPACAAELWLTKEGWRGDRSRLGVRAASRQVNHSDHCIQALLIYLFH